MQTNRERFLESYINRTHTVLGRELKPLCLHHMIHLSRVKSPAVLSRRRVSRADLLLAVAICASSPESIINDLMPALGELKKTDWNFEREKFRAYVRDYFQAPRKWDGKGKPLQVPWEWGCVVRLMREGMTKREALTEPLGLALWTVAAGGEANGGDPGVMSPAEEKALREAGFDEGDLDAG